MLHIVCNPTVPADARPNIKRFRAGYTHPQFAYCVFAILRVPSSAGCCRFEADGLGKTLERLNRDDLSRRLRSEMTPEETILFAFALLAVLDPLHKQTGDDRAFFKESVWSLTSGYVWFAVVGRRGFGMTPFVES